MSDYNQFVMAINKIFEITAKLKAGWKDQDNINIADSIEESKTTVVEAAKLFNTTAPTPQTVAQKDSTEETKKTTEQAQIPETQQTANTAVTTTPTTGQTQVPAVQSATNTAVTTTQAPATTTAAPTPQTPETEVNAQ